jgi:hypothetical protein
MQMSHPGSLYLILIAFKKIVRNQITGHSNITIRPIIVPSVEQILNCLDGYSETPISCNRVVMIAKESSSLSFTSLS